MRRAISMRHTVVPSAERRQFLDGAGRARAHYVSRGCHYWLFEEASLPGAYVEFFEAGSADALRQAHREAPDPVSDAARLYLEVPLS